jgi:SSS family solute:Na+ symporter
VFALKTLNKGYPDAFSWVPTFLVDTPFMMLAFLMCLVCVAMHVSLTMAMPKLPGEDPQQLSWPHPLDALRAPGWPGLLNYKRLALMVIAAMTSLYVIFR